MSDEPSPFASPRAFTGKVSQHNFLDRTSRFASYAALVMLAFALLSILLTSPFFWREIFTLEYAKSWIWLMLLLSVACWIAATTLAVASLVFRQTKLTMVTITITLSPLIVLPLIWLANAI